MYKQFVKSTAVVAGFTLVCRVFGLVRDLLLARTFGASADLEAFIVAFKIPNFMRRLFAEGAFSQAFVPVLMDYRQKKSPQQLAHFVGAVAGGLATSVSFVVLLGLLLAPFVIKLFAPGFVSDPNHLGLAVWLLRVNLPYLFFIAMTAFMAAVLNGHKHFLVPALTPVFLNLALIISSLCLSQSIAPPIKMLALAVLAAGVGQFGLQMLTLVKKQLWVPWQWDWKDSGVRRVKKLMMGALFGVSIVQMGSVVDTIFASFLVHGSIAWIYYAQRLMQFPLGIFGVAVGTVILPQLSSEHAAGSSKPFSELLDWAIRGILMIALPASIGLFCMAQPIITVLFQYGRFSPHDVSMTAHTLRAASLGVLPAMLLKPLVSIFYAKQNMRTPVRAALWALLVNIFLNGVLVWPLKHVGLALATSLALWSNMAFLIGQLSVRRIYDIGTVANCDLAALAALKSRSKYSFISNKLRFFAQFCLAMPTQLIRLQQSHIGGHWGTFIGKLLVASAVLSIWLLGISPHALTWIRWGVLYRMLVLAGLVVSGVGVYLLALTLLGIRLRAFLGGRPQ